VHDGPLDFTAVRPADANFSSLPPGGATQIYTASVSNNGVDFGDSQNYTLFNSSCVACDDDGLVQRVSVLCLKVSLFDVDN